MRLRTFTAPDMQAAIAQVRAAMGDEAIILSSARQGSRGVRVTAALDSDELKVLSAEKENTKIHSTQHSALSTDLRFELQSILRYHNLPELFVAKLMQQAAGKDIEKTAALHRLSGNRDPKYLRLQALEKSLSMFFAFEPLQFTSPVRGEVAAQAAGGGRVTPSLPLPPSGGGNHIMLVGAPGSGKTLTAAKIAAKIALAKQPLTVITTDNKRAGGIEQLQAFTDILGLELKTAASRSELADILAAAEGSVLIDTAGCNPYEPSEINELAGFLSLGGIEPVLVMPAGGDSSEAVDIADAFAHLPVGRLLVTRADTARRLGGVLAAAAAHGLAFCHASRSASIVDSLHPLTPPLLAEFLLRHQLQQSQAA